MFAQVMQAAVRSSNRDELGRIVQERLIPALQHEIGFRGALGMVEPRTGRTMMVALWECEEQAMCRPATRGGAFLHVFAEVESLSEGDDPVFSVWEVGIEL
jgi:hypothetical protein